MLRRAAILGFGVFGLSTAVIMIKACQVAPAPLAGYRLLVAAVVLSPLFLRDWRRNRGRYTLVHLRKTLLPGIVLGLHFVSWIIGARMTQTANASLIVNMTPIVMPFLLYIMIRERINRGELAGTVLAMVGILLIGAADFHIFRSSLWGDAICFGSMILFAWYLAMGRQNRHFPTVWLYIVPLYFFGALVCLIGAGFRGDSFAIDSTRDLLLMLGLGVVPTVVGHSILNYSMRHLRGQSVGIANLGQFIFAGVMGYFLLADAPQWTFYIAAPLAVAGAVIALRSTPQTDLPSES